MHGLLVQIVHPLRVLLLLALNGLVYYREIAVHFDSLNSAYALVMKAGGSHRLRTE